MKIRITYPDGSFREGDWTRKKRFPEIGEEIQTPEGLFFGMRYRVTAADPAKREITLQELDENEPEPLRWITFRFPDGRWRTQRWNKPTPKPGDEIEGYVVSAFVQPARVELKEKS